LTEASDQTSSPWILGRVSNEGMLCIIILLDSTFLTLSYIHGHPFPQHVECELRNHMYIVWHKTWLVSATLNLPMVLRQTASRLECC